VLQVGNRATRPALTAAVASVLAPVAILPHVFEDLVDGTLDTVAGIQMEPLGAGLLIGLALTLQLIGALGAAKERRWGYLVIFLVAAAWIVLAAIDHSEAFVPGDFREGFGSRLAVWGLVGIQAIAALAALTALRVSRRGSFSGTGTVTSRMP
jgi:hypothetical protein